MRNDRIPRRGRNPLLVLTAVLALALAACGGGDGGEGGGGSAGGTEGGGGGDGATAQGAGCDGEVDGPVTISAWFHSGQGGERETLEQQVAAFNESQEDVQVELTLLPEGNYNDQVQAAAASGDLPDVLDFDGPFLYNYAWAGSLQPIDSCVSEELRSNLLPSIVEQGTYADSLYGVGQFDSGLGIFTLRSVLEENDIRIPEGWDDAWSVEEFNDALATLREAGYEQPLDLKINYGQTEWYTYGFSPIIQSAGPGLAAEGEGADLIDRTDYQSADGVLNSPEAVDALTTFQGWFDEEYVDFNEDDAAFVDGRSVLSWAVHNSFPPYQEAFGDDLIIVPLPDFGDGSRTGQGSWQWGVPANAQDADASWAFIEHLLGDEQVVAMTDANGAPPATTSAIEASETFTEDSPLWLFIEALQSEHAVVRPQTPAYPTITTAFQGAIGTIIDGGDVQGALDEAVATIDADIEANQGYPTPEEQSGSGDGAASEQTSE